jgi:hypothetical protein
MKLKNLSDGIAVVDHDYYWQPIETCPAGRKVQLLSALGCAVYGTYNGRDTFWIMWAPLPKKPKNEDS